MVDLISSKSLLRQRVLERFNRVSSNSTPFGGIRLIVFKEFLQLPSVAKREPAYENGVTCDSVVNMAYDIVIFLKGSGLFVGIQDLFKHFVILRAIPDKCAICFAEGPFRRVGGAFRWPKNLEASQSNDS